MKLYVKNKLMTIGGNSKVYDENGEEVYSIKGAIFTTCKIKIIKNKDGEVIYKVKNRHFKFIRIAAYICNAKGKKEVEIRQRAFNKGYSVEGGTDDYDILWGGWFKGTNQITRNGEVYAVIRRKLGFTDVFEIEFKDAKDADFLVAMTIAIDNIIDKERN